MTFKRPSSLPKSFWLNGLRTLGQLWHRGLFPQDLERHYFLYWFVSLDGNILKTAKSLQIHRNTIQGHFLSLGYSKKSVRLRHAWKTIHPKASGRSFEANFYFFYQQFSPKPKLNSVENKGLVGLWKTRFPFQTLPAHYLLWAQREGKSKEWAVKKMDYSFRHRARRLNQLVHPKTRDGFWISPLRPSIFDIRSASSTLTSRKRK